MNRWIGALLVLVVARSAPAAPVTVNFEGTINSFEASIWGTSVSRGGRFSGSYTYDTGALDLDSARPQIGYYEFYGLAPVGMTMKFLVGDNLYLTDVARGSAPDGSGAPSRVTFQNDLDNLDAYESQSSLRLLTGSATGIESPFGVVHLVSRNLNALANDNLAVPDLRLFDGYFLFRRFNPATNGYETLLDGTLTKLEVVDSKPAATLQNISTVAGGSVGDGGPATSANLNGPWGIYVVGSGDLYIADSDNNRIRKIVASTGVITTIAGGGNSRFFSGDGGPATSASLSRPAGVCVDGSGNLYIADQSNNRIRKVAAGSGIITTIAGNGTTGFSGDGGPATSASLNQPSGIFVDGSGNLYIADSNNNRIRMVATGTEIITTLAGNGTAGFSGDDGPATSASLNQPSGVWVDGSGDLYIADQNNNRIRKVATGTGIVTTVAGDGNRGFVGDGGLAKSAQLSLPTGISMDRAGNLYIAELSNQRIRKVAVGTGIIATVAGNGGIQFSGDGGLATSTSLSNPTGVFVDGSGDLYIADRSNHRVRKVAAGTEIITTVAGNGSPGFSGNGVLATSASLFNPSGMFIQSSGDLYIADQGNHRVRKVAAGSGVITTVAGDGNGKRGSFGNDGPAINASLSQPSGVLVDGSGDLYIADQFGHQVRKVAASTGVISMVAGFGGRGFSGDNGPAGNAQLAYPTGITMDGSGNLYIADRGNHRIRKITVGTGTISTVAGDGTLGFSGDGGLATTASLNYPMGVSVDGSGNLYIVDNGNNRIRRVAAGTGIITTIAGNGNFGFSGDGGPATSAGLAGPQGICVDGSGNLYIADFSNNRIRKVVVGTGIITTVAGNGTAEFSGDGGPAINAILTQPAGVAVDGLGNLYIADYGNSRIRKVSAIVQSPAISLSDTVLSLGVVTKGTSGPRTFTVSNSGNALLSISAIYSSNPQFTIEPASFDVPAGSSRTVTVRFSPTKVGWEQSTLALMHNGVGGASIVKVGAIGRVNPPSGSLVNTKVAFAGIGIYAVSGNGTSQTRITNTQDDWPAWSPDGTKIAVSRVVNNTYRIYTINADGTTLKELTQNPFGGYFPAWSPDGTKIAFCVGATDGNIFVMNVDGTNQQQLTNSLGGNYYPSWSPDGTKIAFSASRLGHWDIYVMNADGTNQTQLTNDARTNYYPSWSPDGTKIAFDSDRDGDFEIYVMNADGTNPTQLTKNDRPIGEGMASWSPDGTQIAFWSEREGTRQVYTMNADGTNQTRLTNNNFSANRPSWSPFLPEIKVNTPPMLSGGQVAPATGNEQTEFVFRVTYTDADNNPPSAITIATDNGAPVAMSKPQSDDTYTDGAVYEYRGRLSVGSHTYAFSASDGSASATGDIAAHTGLQVVGTQPDVYMQWLSQDGPRSINSGSFENAAEYYPTGLMARVKAWNNGTTTMYTVGHFMVKPVSGSTAAEPVRVTVTLTHTGNGTGCSSINLWRPYTLIMEACDPSSNGTRTVDLLTNTDYRIETNAQANSRDGATVEYRSLFTLDLPEPPLPPLVRHLAFSPPPPTPVEFGSVLVGQSKSLSLTVTNPDTLVAVSVTQVSSSDPTFVPTPTAFTVLPRSSQALAVVYSPQTRAAHQAILTLTYNTASGPATLSATLSGRGVQPVLGLSPADTLRFGGVQVNATGQQTLTISNTGDADLQVAGITPSDSTFSVSTASFTISPGVSQPMVVSFRPTAAGPKIATLSIAHNAGRSPSLLPLTGTGTAIPTVGPQASVPASLTLPETPVGTSSQVELVVTNTGGSVLSITRMALSGTGAPQFKVTPPTAEVPAGGSQRFTVTFTPTSVGTKLATLSITHNGSPSSSRVSLSGKGVRATAAGTPQIRVSPPSLVMEETYLGTTSQKTLEVSNPGGGPLTISAARVSGAASSQFVVEPLNATVVAGASQLFTVRFAPTSLGGKSATLSLTHNAQGSPTRVQLRGTGAQGPILSLLSNSLAMDNTDIGTTSQKTFAVGNTGNGNLSLALSVTGLDSTQYGVSPVTAVIGAGTSQVFTVTFAPTTAGNKSARVSITHNAAGGASSVTLTGTGTVPRAPEIAMSLSTLTMDATTIGTSTQKTFTLSNTGGGTLVVSDISTEGMGAAQYTVSPRTATIPAGATQTFTVTFTPVSTGPKAATLSIVYNGQASPAVINVQGTGLRGTTVTTPQISISASALVMEDTPVRSSSQKTFTITNAGGGSLSISGITMNGSSRSQFAVSPTNAVLRGGASRIFTVVFSPTATGTKTAFLSIAHNAPGSPSRVSLRGKAISGTSLVMDPEAGQGEAQKRVEISSQALPEQLALEPNYPNPFNPETTIAYQVPESAAIRLEVYDLLGQQVCVLVDQVQPAGFYRVNWSGRDGTGGEVGSGIYFCRLTGGKQQLVRRMLLVR